MMRTRASQYTTQAGNLQDIINAMDRLLTQLQSEWEGEASRAYAAKFAELRPGFVKAKDLIDEISAKHSSQQLTLLSKPIRILLVSLESNYCFMEERRIIQYT